MIGTENILFAGQSTVLVHLFYLPGLVDSKDYELLAPNNPNNR